MAERVCPTCGGRLGQHDLHGDVLTCPNCGATITVAEASGVPQAEAAPPGRSEGRDEFAGHDTVEGVMEEIEEKEEEKR
jgi:uncharacterized Zn finger protein (UPF0148 family)